jgi:hypothetical protein
MDGVELLRRAHALHPGAGRALFVAMDHATGMGAAMDRSCGPPRSARSTSGS